MTLEELYPKVKWNLDLLATYGINTKHRVAMFVAQCAHESMNFSVSVENLNYSASALVRVFGKYFTPVTAQQYARQPKAIANRVYANRMGNGSEDSGDGYKYRGHGYIQLTGKHNISTFARFINKDLDRTLEYLKTSEGALESACWFWKTNNLNSYADNGDIKGCTKRINGGYNGLEERTKIYHKLMENLDEFPTAND